LLTINTFLHLNRNEYFRRVNPDFMVVWDEETLLFYSYISPKTTYLNMVRDTFNSLRMIKSSIFFINLYQSACTRHVASCRVYWFRIQKYENVVFFRFFSFLYVFSPNLSSPEIIFSVTATPFYLRNYFRRIIKFKTKKHTKEKISNKAYIRKITAKSRWYTNRWIKSTVFEKI